MISCVWRSSLGDHGARSPVNTIPISIGNRVALAHSCAEKVRRGGQQLLMKHLVGTPAVRRGRSPTAALSVASERPRVVSAGPRVVSAAAVVVSAAVVVVSAAGAVVSAGVGVVAQELLMAMFYSYLWVMRRTTLPNLCLGAGGGMISDTPSRFVGSSVALLN